MHTFFCSDLANNFAKNDQVFALASASGLFLRESSFACNSLYVLDYLVVTGSALIMLVLKEVSNSDQVY